MSWYSIIYQFVREYRLRNPICGYFLSLCLNTIVFCQILILIYSKYYRNKLSILNICGGCRRPFRKSFYVYTFEFCFSGILKSNNRIALYLLIFYGLLFMLLWSFIQALRSPIARVPAYYYVDKETETEFYKVSLFDERENRYYQDCSSTIQAIQQRKILNTFAERRGLQFAEVYSTKDQQYRYCYNCNIVKPDRCYHCNSCGFCVLRYDHHCPILNTCISHVNYKYFLLYLGYAFLTALWSSISEFEGLVRYFIDGYNDSKNWTGRSLYRFIHIFIAILIQLLLLYYPLSPLFFDHIWYSVIKNNETTREYRRRPIIHPGSNGAASYNLGCWNNLYQIFGPHLYLWLFPLNTISTDGLHYDIGYPDLYVGPRLIVVKKVEMNSYIEKENIEEVVVKQVM